VERNYSLDEFIENLYVFSDCHAEADGAFTRRDLLELALTAVEVLGNWECFSCGVDAFQLGEDFYVRDELWRDYGVEGMLCIGCFERRLGRELIRADFKGGGGPDAWEKFFPNVKASDRYRDRWEREWLGRKES